MVWSSAICNPTVAMASGASGQKKWSNVDLFDAYFRRADLNRDDQISGNEAVAFFQGSGLPKQVLAQHMAAPAGGRPPKAVAPSHAEENQQANQQKPRVPELEKHLENQLSTEEVNSLNSKFKETTEADKKA